MVVEQLIHLGEIAARVLNGNNSLALPNEAREEVGVQVRARESGDVVGHHGHGERFAEGLVVLQELGPR